MTSSQGLYQRFRLLIHEGFKFLVVGGIGAIVTVAGAVALHGLGKYLAITIVTVVGTIVTFLGNRYWTFRHRQGQGATQEGLIFFALNGVGLLIYYACIWIIQDLMRLDGQAWYAVALVVGLGLGTLFRFWSYRKWIWTIGHQPRLAGAEFAGYADAAIASGTAARPVRVGSAAPVARPPGRAPARHAAPRRAPTGRTPAGPPLARSRTGTHRRT